MNKPSSARAIDFAARLSSQGVLGRAVAQVLQMQAQRGKCRGVHSIRIVQFPLVAHGEHANLVPGRDETVQCNVSGRSIGNHQLAQVAFDPPSNQRMARQQIDRRSNGGGRVQRA